jgi:hypothetical protein
VAAHLVDQARQNGLRGSAPQQRPERARDEAGFHFLARADRAIEERAPVLAALERSLPVEPLHRRHQRGVGRVGKRVEHVADAGLAAAGPQRLEHAQLERAEDGGETVGRAAKHRLIA